MVVEQAVHSQKLDTLLNEAEHLVVVELGVLVRLQISLQNTNNFILYWKQCTALTVYYHSIQESINHHCLDYINYML